VTASNALSSDPFDLDFEGEEARPAPKTAVHGEAWAEGADETPATGELLDPFAGLPHEEPPTETEEGASAAGANPITEMLAHAEAALGDHCVPKISIHAFCAKGDTIELVRRAAADRRMERAKTTIHEGGLAAAATFYQDQPTPPLLILETQEPPAQLLDHLGRLAEVCDPGTKVVVVGGANDIALYRELMRRGVSEYLVHPLRPLQLIAAITALYADPAQPFIGRQIAFCGAKGGCGSSTLAHNVAHLIAERLAASTVLVDLDLPFGTAGLDFNQDPLQGIADALSQPDRLDPVLLERMMARCGDHLSLFAAPANLEREYDITPDSLEEVAQKIRASSPYVVLDLPHAWTAWKRRLLIASDDVVIVAEPDLASLRNAKNILDLIRSARPNDAPPRVVLNKVGLPGRPEIPIKDFGEALGAPPAMIIGFDAKLFGQAANNGQMIGEVGPKSRQAESLQQLAWMISRRETVAPAASRTDSLLAKLLKR